MQIASQENKGIKTLDKWMTRLLDSHEYCQYCGKRKKEYLRPKDGKLFPLNCMCDRILENLEKTKIGILLAQFKTRKQVGHKEEKLSGNNKAYVAECEQHIEDINWQIWAMKNPSCV